MKVRKCTGRNSEGQDKQDLQDEVFRWLLWTSVLALPFWHPVHPVISFELRQGQQNCRAGNYGGFEFSDSHEGQIM